MTRDPSWLPARPWAIVDPALAQPSASRPFEQLLALATTNWQVLKPIDVGETQTESLLAKHRVTASIPTTCVAVDQLERFRERVGVIYGTQLRVQAVAHEVLEILNASGIETRVLKGMASADLDYPERGLRQSGDIDVALRFDQFDQGVAALKDHGYTDHHTANSTYLLKGTTLEASNGIEVDLHTRLFQRSGLVDLLFEDPGEPLSDLPGAGLCAEHRLVHAAGHFILTPPGLRRMSGLLDVACLRRRAGLDLDEAQRFADRTGVEAIVGDALRLESTLADRGDDDLNQFADWKTSGWVDRRARLVSERNLVLDHLNRFREVPRSQWLGYLPQWLVPDVRLRAKFVQSVKGRRGN